MPADPPAKGPRPLMAFLGIGTEMASFTLFGLLLDYLLGTMPGFTIGLTLLGLVAAFFHLTRMAKGLATKRETTPPGGRTGAGGGA
jgi:F0F1-type ATP synthase assembly protein I